MTPAETSAAKVKRLTQEIAELRAASPNERRQDAVSDAVSRALEKQQIADATRVQDDRLDAINGSQRDAAEALGKLTTAFTEMQEERKQEVAVNAALAKAVGEQSAETARAVVEAAAGRVSKRAVALAVAGIALPLILTIVITLFTK